MYICKYVYMYICIYVYMYICISVYMYTVTDRIMEKKRFNLQAPPVYDRKVTNLFLFHNYCFHNYCFHNSVGACMSIDSQFECILRGNIEL